MISVNNDMNSYNLLRHLGDWCRLNLVVQNKVSLTDFI